MKRVDVECDDREFINLINGETRVYSENKEKEKKNKKIEPFKTGETHLQKTTQDEKQIGSKKKKN